jgi:CO dehydrogenase/acetyl-CoA synthase alpha subunit
MPRWEVCKIEIREERRERVGGLFSSGERAYYRYVAVADTPQGQKDVDQSDVYQHLYWRDYNKDWDKQNRESYEHGLEERSKLIGRLLANGWEPIQSNERGEVISLRRSIP